MHPREPRGLEVGPPPPELDHGHPYPGIGVDNLDQRMRAFFAGFGGTFLGCDATPNFFRRLVMVDFFVALPFTDDASWRHEGGTTSRRAYAADHISALRTPCERPLVDAATQTEDSLGAVERNYAGELAAQVRNERRGRGEDEFSVVEWGALARTPMSRSTCAGGSQAASGAKEGTGVRRKGGRGPALESSPARLRGTHGGAWGSGTPGGLACRP